MMEKQDWTCKSCGTEYGWRIIRPNPVPNTDDDQQYIITKPKTVEEVEETELFILTDEGAEEFEDNYFDYLYECHDCCQKWLAYAIKREKEIVHAYYLHAYYKTSDLLEKIK